MNELDDLLSGIRSTSMTHVAVLVREVRVKVGVLSRPVTIRIFYDGHNSHPYTFETSSVVKTATGRATDDTDVRTESENDALRRAVRMLTQDYDEAVRRGEMPDDAWLVAPEVVRTTN